MEKKVLLLAKKLESEMVSWRRTLHRNPELSFEEYETTSFIAEKLREFGCENIKIGFGPISTGLTAEIGSSLPCPAVALRADIDALPIHEETNHEWRSCRDGISHSCGHDAHTAILLAAASILSEMKAELKSPVRLIFQPAEERSVPGAKFKSGAAFVRESGALDGVGAIFGLHVWGDYPAGKICCAKGPVTSAVASFSLEVNGRGGHGAQPHFAIDPIMTSCNVASLWQQIVSREVDAIDSLVLTIGKIEAGTQYNIIPSKAFMEGTCRTLSKETLDFAAKRMEKIASCTCEGMRCTCNFSFKRGHDSVRNDARAVDIIKKSAEEMFGEDSYVTVPPVMVGEDFSLYTDIIPGALFFLGLGDEAKGTNFGQHHPKFTVNDDVISRGAAMLALAALKAANIFQINKII